MGDVTVSSKLWQGILMMTIKMIKMVKMETVIVMMTYITREQVGDVTVSSKLWQTKNTGDKSSIWLIGDAIAIIRIATSTIFTIIKITTITITKVTTITIIKTANITITKITIFTILITFLPFLLLITTVVIIIILACLGFSKKAFAHTESTQLWHQRKYLLQTAVFKVKKKFIK